MAALKFSYLKMKKKNISDQQDVCEVFNDFFVNVAKDIGSSVDISHDFKSHPSIIKITENLPEVIPVFPFKEVSKKDVEKIKSKFDTNY